MSEPVQHLLCPSCADEVHEGLLRLLAGEEPLSERHQGEQELPLTLRARAGGFLLRMGAYGLIAAGVFGVVALLSTR